MDSKSVLTKTRKWHEPNILAWVNNEEIGLGMKLDDYLVALSHEIGDVRLKLFKRTLTQAELLSKLREVSVKVEAEMHEKSASVV